MKKFIILCIVCSGLIFCNNDRHVSSFSKKEMINRAEQTLNALYRYYSVENSSLLHENYPFDDSYSASYLAAEEVREIPNLYSYLWPYSGTFSAVNALADATNSDKYKELIETKVLTGLGEYRDNKRSPEAYASYINSAPDSDRFYDDNIWVGIDFVDLYNQYQNLQYLEEAKSIWEFIESGNDDKLGGGIYWCEQRKEGKNTCSNAPAAVYALKLFKATGDSTYFYKGKSLYEWTQKNLQDKNDYLYYDHITLNGEIGEAKYAYNSGQMLQAASLLYQLTRDNAYLTEARNIAEACYNHFFQDFTTDQNYTIRLLKNGDTWFSAVMLRGFIELYNIDKKDKYIHTFGESLDYAWRNSRDEKGLFSTDWSGQTQDSVKWLLTQAAMVEMYARLGSIK